MKETLEIVLLVLIIGNIILANLTKEWHSMTGWFVALLCQVKYMIH